MSKPHNKEHLRMIALADQAWSVIESFHDQIALAVERNRNTADEDTKMLVLASTAALGYVLQRQLETKLAVDNNGDDAVE